MKSNNIPSDGRSHPVCRFPKFASIAKALRQFPVLSAILMLANVGALAQVEVPFVLEDFEDGDATDGNPVTWVPGWSFPTGSSGTVTYGSYVLTTTGTCAVEADEPASIGDVSIRALVRGLSVGSGTYISFYAHGQPDGSSHWAVVTQLGLHTGYTVKHNSPTIIGTVVNSSFDRFTGDVNIQLEVCPIGSGGKELESHGVAARLGQAVPTSTPAHGPHHFAGRPRWLRDELPSNCYSQFQGDSDWEFSAAHVELEKCRWKYSAVHRAIWIRSPVASFNGFTPVE